MVVAEGQSSQESWRKLGLTKKLLGYCQENSRKYTPGLGLSRSPLNFVQIQSSSGRPEKGLKTAPDSTFGAISGPGQRSGTLEPGSAAEAPFCAKLVFIEGYKV